MTLKTVALVTESPPTFRSDAVRAAPPPQQYKATPPGILTREHRSDPRSSHFSGLSTYSGLNRIGSASWLSQQVLRYKRRSQLSQNTPPQGPYVLYPFPCRYGEGDMDPVDKGSNPSAWDAFKTAEQASGLHQGRGLVDTEPATLHEFVCL